MSTAASSWTEQRDGLNGVPNTARAAVPVLPHAPGVYRFRDAARRVLYIGRAADLRQRVGSYWSNLGDRQRLARMVERIASIEAVECASEHEAAWLERNVLERSMPRWNRAPGGQEVPVHVRLDERPGVPGLSVVHEVELAPRTRHFGPYLGGLKVRVAVSGLRRALPLALSGARVSGFERDLARIRGVAPADRLALVEALSKVLRRDERAVRSAREELARRRDRAAEHLAFELAARVQAELDALDWVVAEQRVTVSEPSDLDVYGWASGVLVHFEVRGGRMNQWRQRSCDEGVAQSRLAGTPDSWRDFAQRNAALAARLLATELSTNASTASDTTNEAYMRG
jgi:excinuclease ABC subunit C